MGMKWLVKLTTLAAAILFTAVVSSSQQVRYNFLPDIDFAKYKSYRWTEVKGDDYSNSVLGGQVKQAIESELARKGLTKVAGGDSDLVVAFQLAMSEERKWKPAGEDDAYWGWGGWGGWGGSSDTKSATIAKGTLNLDIYDSAMKKQVWRGEVTKIVRKENDPKKIEKNVKLSVAKLMHNYPPLALKKGP